MILPTPKSAALKELEGRIEAKAKRQHELMSNKDADGRVIFADDAARDEFKSIDAELNDLGPQRDEQRAAWLADERNAAMLKSIRQPHMPIPFGTDFHVNEAEQKSIGQQFIESPNYKAYTGAGDRQVVDLADFNLKTLMTTSAGFAAANNRTNVVVPFALRRPMVADLIPQDQTTLSQIKYMVETTFTNNAATVAEGAVKPEGASVWTQTTAQVQKIAVTLPVTEEQIMDVPAIQGVIDNRLGMMVMLTEENQLLNGTGVSPQLQGFLSAAAATAGVQTQALGADNVPDAVLAAMTKVQHTGFSDVSGIVFHPNDWMAVRTLKESGTGAYIWGSPSEAGPQRIWGQPVIVTTAMTENTALVGDFRMYSHISRRLGLRIDMGYVNDDFTRNQVTMRAEERLSLEILRYSAFCKVTGI
ncbi:MAG: phage major capsid protein [Gemmatimonadaceae bacterium]|nr:phage major capsid protein [Gemmatimonadaceae bacterium]